MKVKLCFLTLFFGFAIFSYAQDIPPWARMGMTLSQVRQNISGNQWHEDTSSHSENRYVFFKQGENAGIYLFFILPQKGLVGITIMLPNATINSVADYLSKKYGNPYFSDAYIWTENLPSNVVYLGIDNYEGGKFGVRYVFENYLD